MRVLQVGGGLVEREDGGRVGRVGLVERGLGGLDLLQRVLVRGLRGFDLVDVRFDLRAVHAGIERGVVRVVGVPVVEVLLRISIHALRKESDRAAGHFCPLSETQASCLALSISNNTTGTTNNMPKTSSCLSVSF